MICCATRQSIAPTVNWLGKSGVLQLIIQTEMKIAACKDNFVKMMAFPFQSKNTSMHIIWPVPIFSSHKISRINTFWTIQCWFIMKEGYNYVRQFGSGLFRGIEIDKLNVRWAHFVGRANYNRHVICTRADSKLAPSQWETSLQSNAVSHWLDANLESALCIPLHAWLHIPAISKQLLGGAEVLLPPEGTPIELWLK